MSVSVPIAWLDGQAKLATRIISHFPAHRTYVAPFGGSAAVLLGKPPSPVEAYNATDSELGNLLRVLQDARAFRRFLLACEATRFCHVDIPVSRGAAANPVEAARRFVLRRYRSGGGGTGGRSKNDGSEGDAVARRWLAAIERFPAIHRRLRDVCIEAADWSALIARHDGPDTLFHLEPPGAGDSRGSPRRKLAATDRDRLFDILAGMRGMAVWTGRRGKNDERLAALGWQRVDYEVPGYSSPLRGRRQESLWLSPRAMAARGLPADPAVEAMRIGAYRTHCLRVQSTEMEVARAIDKLRRSGDRVTIAAVARQIDMSREHLSRRYRHLFEPA